MTLLAGYDFILEISRETITKLLKRTIIGGKSLNPPFELSIPFSYQGISGNMHLIVKELGIALKADDSIETTFSFENSGTSVSFITPSDVTVSKLSGNITIKLSPKIKPTTGPSGTSVNLVTLIFLPKASGVTVEFSQSSINKLTPYVNVSKLVTGLQNSLNQNLQAVSFQTGLDFALVPPGGINGSPLGPTFVSLEPHCIEPNALGLFGMFFANRPKGNHQNKTTTVISSGNDISVSFSPEVIRTFMICPGLAQSLGAGSVSDLPSVCGGAEDFPLEDGHLTNIYDSFDNGFINLEGTVTDSGFCYEAEANFHGYVTMQVTACNSIGANVHFDEPDVDVDIDFWCGPAGVFLDWFGTTMNVVTTSIIESVAEDLSASALDAIAAKGIQTPAIPTVISGICFTEVSITPEGITINATMNIVLAEPAQRGVKLEGTILSVSKEQVGSGSFSYFFAKCGPATFSYTEYTQVQLAKYTAFPSLLAEPLKLDWYVKGTGGKTYLQNIDGQVSTECTVKDPFPPPYGTSIPNKLVQLKYEKHPELRAIDITNRAEDLNYSLVLGVKVTDALNNVVTAETTLDFEGHPLEIPGLAEFLEKCAEIWGNILHNYRPIDKYVSPEELIDYPSPEAIAASIKRIINSGIPERKDLMTIMKMKWGKSFDIALNLMNSGKAVSGKEVV